MAGNTARELAYRESQGLEITLLWHPADDSLTVLVVDTWSGTSFALTAERDRVLDVFNHPFAHVSLGTLPFCAPERRLAA
jgi:hypothetical protein